MDQMVVTLEKCPNSKKLTVLFSTETKKEVDDSKDEEKVAKKAKEESDQRYKEAKNRRRLLELTRRQKSKRTRKGRLRRLPQKKLNRMRTGPRRFSRKRLNWPDQPKVGPLCYAYFTQ